MAAMLSLTPIRSVVSCTLVFAACFAVACSSDSTPTTNAPSDGGASDALASNDTSTNDSALPILDGAADSATDHDANCENTTAPLPDGMLTIDNVIYYVVSTSQQADPNFSRTQINFGTEAQFHSCPEEVGQNSTFVIVMTFKTKPQSSSAYSLSDSRSPVSGAAVNFYLTFFNNRGTSHDNKNYLSPGTGQISATIENGKFTAPVSNMTMTNEVSSGDTFTMSGNISIPWQ